MSFIDRELARLNRALDQGAGNPRYPEIYAAQQALAWACDPEAFRAPWDYLSGIPASSEDCLAVRRPAQS